MAKGVTLGLLEIWHSQLPLRPSIRAEQCVDDFVVSVRGSADLVAEHAVPQALLLRDLLHRAGFTLAKKSAWASSDVPLALAVAERLGRHSMPLLAPTQLQGAVRDLGVPSTGGRRQPAARAAWARLCKTRPRAKRYGHAAAKLGTGTQFFRQAIDPAIGDGTRRSASQNPSCARRAASRAALRAPSPRVPALRPASPLRLGGPGPTPPSPSGSSSSRRGSASGAR